MLNAVGIYDADSGVLPEITYAIRKILGIGQCALCELTHGWNPRGRRSWKAACKKYDIDVTLTHRNNASAEQIAIAQGLPAIIVDQGDSWVCVVSTSELESHMNDPNWILEKITNTR